MSRSIWFGLDLYLVLWPCHFMPCCILRWTLERLCRQLHWAAGRWMARLADTALPFILQSSRSWGRRRRRNEWTEKEEHLTANGREGVKERGEQMFEEGEQGRLGENSSWRQGP